MATKVNIQEVDFLKAYKIDENLCDDIINYFETTQEYDKFEGKVYDHRQERVVKPDVKQSIDMHIHPQDENLPEVIKRYFNELKSCVQMYIQEYPFVNEYGAWGVIDNFNIQKYPAGGAFHGWHTERGSATGIASSRHMVYMTYLNDVIEEDELAGGTEFYHQKIVTQARKGYTLLWPADWTFTHKGIPATHTEKYILTGWFNFLPPPEE